MYKSPIEIIWNDIVSDAVEKADEYIVSFVQQVGVNVDKDELIKALRCDRGQYEKGWNDRDGQIVRCKDCMYRDGNACDYSAVYVRPHGYCQWGRREEDEID